MQDRGEEENLKKDTKQHIMKRSEEEMKSQIVVPWLEK